MEVVQNKAEATSKTQKPRESHVEFLASLASTLVTVLFIMTFIGQTFAIPSSSMENTLLIGDHLFVERVKLAPATRWLGWLLPYRDLHRGDIVVFLSPVEENLHLVKRVIGVPGDRIHLRDGAVYRNGQKLDEPYVIHQSDRGYDYYRDNFPAARSWGFAAPTSGWQKELQQHLEGDDLVVPPGNYFVMGDNRDVSNDSRYWGFVPRENVIGTPTYIYWSFEASSDEYMRRDIADRVMGVGHAVLHFFDKTRWRRTFSSPR